MQRIDTTPGEKSTDSLDFGLPHELEEKLANTTQLPSLPASALQIVALAQAPDSSLGEYAAAIEQDPALTLKLLSLANTVMHSHGVPAETCQQAVSRLGIDATLSVALGFSLSQGYQPANKRGLNLPRFWQRALLSALASYHLAQHYRLENSGSAFTLGLLQDIGMLALDACDAERYAQFLRDSGMHHETLCHYERSSWGCDHAQVGAWVAAHWRLPERLVSGIAQSHAVLDDKNSAQLPPIQRCVVASGLIADSWLGDTAVLPVSSLLPILASSLEMDADEMQSLVELLHTKLPTMTQLFEITLPRGFDSHSVLFQAKQVLHEHNQALSHKLLTQHQEIEKLRNSHATLDRRVRFDALTELYNRSHLEALVKRHFHLARQEDHPLAVIFIDLDHFKLLNDRHGHRAGDQVLVGFAALLKELLDENTLGGRYGGEEFLMLLPGSDNQRAYRVAERLSERLAAHPLAYVADVPLYVTASFGIANLTDETFDTPLDLIHAADQGMYVSKHKGRARISLYRHASPPFSPSAG